MTAQKSDGTSPALPPVWSTPLEAARVILHPAHLRKTLSIAAVVGSLLFVINQLDVVLQGRTTTIVWIKVALTYVVPFCVSNMGILIAARRTP